MFKKQINKSHPLLTIYITVGYYKALGATNCPTNEIVITKQECKTAASKLKLQLRGKFESKSHIRPNGCHWNTFHGPTPKVVFNTVLDPSALDLRPSIALHTGGICQAKGDSS